MKQTAFQQGIICPTNFMLELEKQATLCQCQTIWGEFIKMQNWCFAARKSIFKLCKNWNKKSLPKIYSWGGHFNYLDPKFFTRVMSWWPSVPFWVVAGEQLKRWRSSLSWSAWSAERLEGFHVCLGFLATVTNTGKIFSPSHLFQLSSLRRDWWMWLLYKRNGKEKTLGSSYFSSSSSRIWFQSVGCIVTWRRGCEFHLERVEGKQWFLSVSGSWKVLSKSFTNRFCSICECCFFHLVMVFLPLDFSP